MENKSTEQEQQATLHKTDVRRSKKRLTASEQKIYDAVMAAFPATHPDSAYNVAVQGGVRFDFRAT